MSYNLPEDGDRLKWKMKKSEGEIWIVKPPGICVLSFAYLWFCVFVFLIVKIPGASCGNGIKLVTQVSAPSPSPSPSQSPSPMNDNVDIFQWNEIPQRESAHNNQLSVQVEKKTFLFSNTTNCDWTSRSHVSIKSWWEVVC